MAVRLELQVIRGKPWNIDKVRQEVLNTLRKEGTEVKRLFDKTTKTWSKKPKFTKKIELTRADGAAAVTVSTDDERYGWIDEGTSPYTIRPRNAPLLRFRVPSRAKTKPRWISSRKGSTGNQWVSARSVNHPGIKARHFSEVIQKRREKKFPGAMRKAVSRGIKRAVPK